MGIAAVLLGKALFYAFHGCIGMMGFWLESEPPLLLLAVSFICGEYLPIALMPSGMQKLIAYLPFKYTIYLPVQIFLGKVDVITALSGILIQIGWIAFFTIILHVLYLFGIRRYQAFGG
jgi:ABC-2 type transport system permease protein